MSSGYLWCLSGLCGTRTDAFQSACWALINAGRYLCDSSSFPPSVPLTAVSVPPLQNNQSWVWLHAISKRCRIRTWRKAKKAEVYTSCDVWQSKWPQGYTAAISAFTRLAEHNYTVVQICFFVDNQQWHFIFFADLQLMCRQWLRLQTELVAHNSLFFSSRTFHLVPILNAAEKFE